MYFVEKAVMKKCIESTSTWLNAHPKLKQWIWFALLWIGGLTSFWVLAYPFKLLIKSLG
jgi:hypothetical protein